MLFSVKNSLLLQTCFCDVCDVKYATAFMLSHLACKAQECGSLLGLPMYHVSVSVCLCLLDATVSPTKTAGPIEVLFGLRTRVAPLNLVLRGGLDPPWEKEIQGHLQADCEVSGIYSVSRS